ncbi:MAG: tRNA (adenosine(37)-N6)-threonylcarbamoyltransferase complex transferase subunit TsaD [bacterium]|nr:tRNA (adenosine(37)-N6)-threonylcarbamoyltransferase complex transferase subunit TsaD [bacterium]
MKSALTKILAIETSCDETAAAVLIGSITAKKPSFRIASSVVHSQIEIHKGMGGVVPEVAARAHMQYILPITEKALVDAKLALKDLHYIAVTSGPGLVVSLIVGTEFAKGLSLASGIPLLPTNHMSGHLYSAFAENPGKVKFPVLSLIVSGGHTMFVLMKDYKHYQVIGETVDDAAGEAFDKVARLLKLPYPGGPEISKLAKLGKTDIKFPRPMLSEQNFKFSFSGLKTAVLYYIERIQQAVPLNAQFSIAESRSLKNIERMQQAVPLNAQFSIAESRSLKNIERIRSGSPQQGNSGQKQNSEKTMRPLSKQQKADIAMSFENAVVDVLVTKALRAVKKYNCKTVSLSGGVAANTKLRESLQAMCTENKLDFSLPEFELCTDNAQMIAMAAYFHLYNGGKPTPPGKVKADPSWELK